MGNRYSAIEQGKIFKRPRASKKREKAVAKAKAAATPGDLCVCGHARADHVNEEGSCTRPCHPINCRRFRLDQPYAPFRGRARGGDVSRPPEVETAAGTLKVGDVVPLPPAEKLKINPAKWVDDSAKGPRGVFHSRGGAK